MARGATIVVENNFTQGLVTEFSAMNFPENAVTDGDNVVFSELGKVTRRNGINFEEGFVEQDLATLSPVQGVFTEFKWDSVGGQGNTSFVVQQVGSRIRFFQIAQSSLSSQLKPYYVDLLTYKTSVTDQQVAENRCSFSAGKGYLFVTHQFCDPLSIQYDSETDTITVNKILIEVRDFERLDDGLEVDERPSVLTDVHKYNLYNQGWYFDAIVRGSDNPRNVLTAWRTVRGDDYPSNADIWWVYKDAVGVAYFGKSRSDGRIGPSQITLGNTPSSNGHYIYDAWDINRSTKTGIPNLPSETSGIARPSCTAFFAGRIFYAGIAANGYADKLYFTQIIESDDQFGKCFQVNDPTSETIFDLLDSDGGVISLPLVSKITSLQVLNDALIVIGTNGIFAIRGTDSGPFRATDYSVEYVSEVGTNSPGSIINVDNSLIWWNYDALYVLTKDNIGVFYQVQNASKPTIQSVIDSVPPANKDFIKGVYNKKERIVQWLFNDNTSPEDFSFNRILEFNVVSKAFYTHTINTDSSPKIVGILSVSGQKREVFSERVTTGAGVVTDNSLNEVTINVEQFIPNVESFKYSTVSNDDLRFTYSDQKPEHADWGDKFFNSFFESGYRIRGEFLRSFTSTPISVILDNLEDGSVIFQGIWDYGFRRTMEQELYSVFRETDIRRNWHRGDYIIRRLKPRGKGKSFQLSFKSVDDKPFSLVGWSTFDTGGNQP